MSRIVYHPGIENEYKFASWEEAREKLEAWHGGLASRMLANCREIEVTDLAERLKNNGFEDSGAEYNNTRVNLGQSFGGEEYDYCGPEDKTEIRRFIRLSENRWAKGFYTDPAGNPCLIWVAKYGAD